MYAIGRLILNNIKKQKLTIKKLVELLGYEDLETGEDEVKNAIATGEYYEILENNLHKIFNIRYEEVRYAYIQTIKKMNKEKIVNYSDKQKAAFECNVKLFVIIKEKNDEKNIMKKNFKRIAIPYGIQNLRWIEKIKIVQEMIQNHYEINKNQVSIKGHIVAGYAFYKYENNKIYEKVYFDITGHIVKIITPNFPSVISALVNNNKKVLSLAKIAR